MTSPFLLAMTRRSDALILEFPLQRGVEGAKAGGAYRVASARCLLVLSGEFLAPVVYQHQTCRDICGLHHTGRDTKNLVIRLRHVVRRDCVGDTIFHLFDEERGGVGV